MAKLAVGLALPVFGEPATEPVVALYRQIYQRIRSTIVAGVLGPGARLPSSRTLARDMGVSRNTVEVAFSRLEAEGFVVRRVGAGTYVGSRLPGPRTRPPKAPLAARAQTAGSGARPLSKRGQLAVTAATQAGSDSAEPRLFAACVPGLDSFPGRAWRRLVARHSRVAHEPSLLQGDAAGYRPLREVLAAYLAAGRAVKCDWRQIVILSSTQQALDLAARVLLDPGDPVWMEEPGYLGARAAFQGASASLIPVAVDEHGLSVDQGVAQAPGARLAYVTPSHQYPMGVTMSRSRRLALLDWASRAGAWVLEDDYDSEFRYSGWPLAALQGLDSSGRVVYTGTFNKVLFPTLRLAYAVVSEPLVDAFVAARTIIDGHAPTFMQAVLTDFIAAGHLSSHIRRMRALYQERRDALLAAVAGRLDGRITLQPTDTGLHAIGWLPPETDDRAVSGRAAAKGLDLPPLSRYYLGPRIRPGLLFSYAGVPPPEIARGIDLLATVL